VADTRPYPDSDRVRAAVLGHVDAWNAQDRARWVDLWTDDVTFDDPVGAPTKRGRRAVELSWDRSHRPGRRWILEPQRIIVGGDEAAVVMHNHGTVDGARTLVVGVEIYRVAPDGRIAAVRAYFEPPADVALDDYFTVTGQGEQG
jgi:ketosteroid isomerase-like protein